MFKIGKIVIYDQTTGVGKIILEDGEQLSFTINEWNDFEVFPSVGLRVKIMKRKVVPLSDDEFLNIEKEKVEKEKRRQELLPVKNYEELKKYLLEIFKPYGYTKETIFPDNSWLLGKEKDLKTNITISMLSKEITFFNVENVDDIISHDELSGYMIIVKVQGRVRKRINLMKQKDKDELVKKKKEKKLNDIKSSNNITLVFLIFMIFFILFSIYRCSESKEHKTINVSNSDYCYDIGFKQGSCIMRKMNGLECQKGTDLVMPLECRNTSSGQRGIKAGMKSEK